MSVPTYGAIMLDPEMKYCLLVQGFWAKASWGFPKGKVNASEPASECAIREVYEETGFDVANMLSPEDFLENKMSDQVTRLYIIQNVPLDTKFQPKTRKEIKSLQWFPLDALPAHKRDQISKTQLGLNPNTFFMVIPFVKQLRKWVSNKQSAAAAKPPSRPRSSNDNFNGNKSTKETDNLNNSNKQNRDKQKMKHQQYFAQMNQNEYQEFLQFKDSKTRAHEARDRKQRSDTDKGGRSATKGYLDKGGHSAAQGYGSPNYNSDKKQQFHILNRDGTVGGKPRRSLATQFDNQEPPPHQGKHNTKYDKRQQNMDQRSDQRSEALSDGFVPQAWSNFKFDVDAIMACLG